MKNRVPVWLALFASLFPVAGFFLPARWIDTWFNQRLDRWMVIVASFALLLGVVSMIRVNAGKIRRRAKGWGFSVVVLASFAAMASLGLFGRQGERADGSLYPFTWTFQFVVAPLQATMFSLLAFYVASAAYRAFRVRNLEATLLLIGALVIMFGRIPIGQLIHPALPEVAEWVMKFPNTAAQRGILIGAALGAAAMSVRIMLGIERPYMGRD